MLQGKQVPILLSSVGTTTYSLLSVSNYTGHTHTKSLQEISAILCKHYELKHSIIAKHFHLHKHNQAAGETITDFDAALRKLAMAMEAAKQNMKFVKGTETAVHKLSGIRPSNSTEKQSNQRSANSRERNPCFRCGHSNYAEAHCKLKEVVCHQCGKLGYITPVC